MFRNIRNYVGRPILTKPLLNTAPDKENMTINTVPSYLVLWSWLQAAIRLCVVIES